MNDSTLITARNLELRDPVMRNVSFDVRRGDVLAIMGSHDCGKSALLGALIGLVEPTAGEVRYGDQSFTHATPQQRDELSRHVGVVFPFGALWRTLTLRENVALPMSRRTSLGPRDIRALVELKLALVGLGNCLDCFPDQISLGMQKRAGLARAMALDPEVVFFDEPSSGLDPTSARELDDLILALHSALGLTMVVVSHDLDSIFAIANDSVYLDRELGTVIARGDPKDLLAHPPNPQVHAFLTRAAAKEST